MPVVALKEKFEFFVKRPKVSRVFFSPKVFLQSAFQYFGELLGALILSNSEKLSL